MHGDIWTDQTKTRFVEIADGRLTFEEQYLRNVRDGGRAISFEARVLTDMGGKLVRVESVEDTAPGVAVQVHYSTRLKAFMVDSENSGMAAGTLWPTSPEGIRLAHRYASKIKR